MAGVIVTLYTLAFRRTPVIFVNGRLVSQGRVPSLEEISRWVREAHNRQGKASDKHL